MALFFPVAWVIGNKLLPLVLKWESKMHHKEASLAIVISLLLVYAWAAEELGSVATITGAYLLGVIFAKHVEHDHIVHTGISSIGYGFFIPIFFVNVGLQAEMGGIAQAGLFVAILSVFAVLSKVIGSGGGALVGGLTRRESFLIGCGMVSRGEVALVIAGAGLTAGLLTAEVFSLLVFVTLFTTLVTPPLLRLANSNISLRGIRARMDDLPALSDGLNEDGQVVPQGLPGD
jgi:Kef-type K+ transport system membrane component KefB